MVTTGSDPQEAENLTRPHPESANVGLHRFACVTAVTTLLVLIAGASVTSTGSGLSVPDWPLSYGKFFPPMVGGVFFEHGHRMIAFTVAVLLLVMAVWTWRVEPRGWVRALASLALALVLGQALLGGLTVLLLLPTSVSVAHAATAMLLFLTVVSFAAVTSRAWRTPSRLPGGSLSRLGAVATGVTVLVFAQILVGAIMRHSGAGLACPDFPLCHGRLIPPLHSFHIAIHFYHRVGGVVVAIAVVGLAAMTATRAGGQVGIVRLALLAAALVGVQFVLGVASILTRLAPVVTVAHHAGGALLLALVSLIALWSYRLRSRESSSSSDLPVGLAEGAGS